MENAKLKTIVIALILLAAVIIPVYSAYVTHQIPTGIKVVSAVVRVYWDEPCTELVTRIDYGEVTQGQQVIDTTLYIKNEGTGAVSVYWRSTLSQITDRMYDQWYDWTNSQWLNGSVFAAGSIHQTRYTIVLYMDAPLGLYNWTLSIGVLE